MCAVVWEVYQLISACADRFPLSTKREICLSYDRRGLPPPSHAHGCLWHESTQLSDWRFCLQGLLLYSYSQYLITPLLLEKINSLANSHSERWDGSGNVSKWATSTSEYLEPHVAWLKFNKAELEPEKKTPGWWLDLKSSVHQLLPCLSLILCSLLRWSCLFTLVKSNHLSSPIYKLPIDPADPVTPCHTFKSKPGLLGPIPSDCHSPERCSHLLSVSCELMNLIRQT